MDIIILAICIIGIWICLATAPGRAMNKSDIDEDIDKKFGKK